MEIDFESPDLRRFSDALEDAARRGIPHAARNTLNATAFEARKLWIGVAAAKMTLRNKWTTRSMRVDKARGVNVRTMHSTLGSVADYMATQESGATEAKTGKHGVPIPTSIASGEGRGKSPRKRLVRRPNRLPSIQLGARATRGSRAQRNVVAVKEAVRTKQRFVYLDLGNRQGIFRVRGGRRPKIDMVWDLSETSVRIPPSATLTRTLALVTPFIPGIAERALLDQLRRWRVIGF